MQDFFSLFQAAGKNKRIAINGVLDFPSFRRVFLPLTGDKKLVPLEAKDIKAEILYEKIAQEINRTSSNTMPLDVSLYDLDDLMKELNKYETILDHLYLLIDLTSATDDEIIDVFSAVRTIYRDGLFYIIVAGNWNHNHISSELKKASSYPFNPGVTEFYMEDTLMSPHWIQLVSHSQGLGSIDESSAQILHDFTKGEVWSTLFVLQNGMPQHHTITEYREHFRGIAYEYYEHYINVHPLYKMIVDIVGEQTYPLSIIPNTTDHKDILLRSNLFKTVEHSIGAKRVFTPLNYFSKFILMNLGELKPMAQMRFPEPPILTSQFGIVRTVMQVEQEMKHVFSSLWDELKRVGFNIDVIPLFHYLGNGIITLTTPATIFKEEQERFASIWEYEESTDDHISLLSLGRFSRLLSMFNDSYEIKSTFTVPECGLQSIELTNSFNTGTIEGRMVSCPTLNLKKDDFLSVLSIPRRTECVLTVQSRLSDPKYYYSPKLSKLSNFIDGQKDSRIVPHSPSMKKVSPNYPFLKDLKKTQEVFASIRDYRNAIAHLRSLSGDAQVQFQNLMREYYRLALVK